MKFFKSLLTILFFLGTTKLFADGAPGIDNKLELEFRLNGKLLEKVDSIIIYSTTDDIYKQSDTLFLNKNASETRNFLMFREGAFFIKYKTKINTININVYLNNVNYQTGNIKLKGYKSLLILDLKNNGKIYEQNSIFYSKWSNYFYSIGITLILEILFLCFFRQKLGIIFTKALSILIISNIITHPIIWFLLSHFDINVFILEIGVFIIEGTIYSIFLKDRFKTKSIFKFSLFANWISWWVGGIILYLIENNNWA